MFKKFYFTYILLILFIICLSTNFSYSNNSNQNSTTYANFSTSKFNWPVPGNYTITSKFGPRKSPTSGASSVHSGIDIAATENTNIYSVLPGVVTFTGFKGAGGYSITIKSNDFEISYCHVSPNYIVKPNDIIKENTIIGFVGPKYVYNVPNNNYKDSSGKPTNGATTGCHLHLTIKKDGKAVNPLDYL